MSRHVVDWPSIADAVEENRTRLGLSDRELGRQLGIDYCALSRLRHGKHLSAANLAALVGWLTPDALPDWIRKIPCPTCLDRLPSTWHCTECGAGPAPKVDQQPPVRPPSAARETRDEPS